MKRNNIHLTTFICVLVVMINGCGSQKQELKSTNEMPSILPIQVPTHKTKMYRYASVFGNRLNPITKQREFHNGLDISTRIGIPVIATADGVITQLSSDRLLGRTVQIRHEATQIETLYGHLGKYATDIRVQKKVKRGEFIGFVGNSGHSAEPHLHYGVYVEGEWKDPMDYIADNPQKR